MDRGAWQAIYSPWGCKELDRTQQLTVPLFTKIQLGLQVIIYFLHLRKKARRS